MSIIWGFTEKDSNISRDVNVNPLGFQSIWSDVGHKLVRGLTTQSNGLPNFISFLVLLKIVEEYNSPTPISTFFVLERLMVFSFIEYKDSALSGLRGNNRLKNLTKDDHSIIKPFDISKSQILNNQKENGIFGHYKTPLKEFKLITTDDIRFPLRLTKYGNKLVKRIIDVPNSKYESLKNKVHAFLKLEKREPSFKDFEGRNEMQWLREMPFRGHIKDIVEGWFDKDLIERMNQTTFSTNKTENDFLIFIQKQAKDTTAPKLQAICKDIQHLEGILWRVEKIFYLVLHNNQVAKKKEITSLFSALKKGVQNPDFELKYKSTRNVSELLKTIKDSNSESDFIQKLVEYHGCIMKNRDRNSWIIMGQNNEYKTLNHIKTPNYLTHTSSIKSEYIGRHYYLDVLLGILQDLKLP